MRFTRYRGCPSCAARPEPLGGLTRGLSFIQFIPMIAQLASQSATISPTSIYQSPQGYSAPQPWRGWPIVLGIGGLAVVGGIVYLLLAKPGEAPR